MTKRSMNFSGKVIRSAKKHDRDSSPGYLTLPEDVEFFVPIAGGRAMLDFLPYVVTDDRHPDKDEEAGTAMKGDYWFMRPFQIHREIGPENVTVICPISVGRKCPICQARAELLQERKDYKDPDVKALAPKKRVLYIVVPIGMKKYEEDPHIWDFSYHNFHKLLRKELEEDDANENFAHIEDGTTVHIRFDEEKFETNTFAKASRIDFKERDYAYDFEFVDEMPDLDELIHSHVLGFKELEALFFQIEDMDEPEAESDAEPTKTAGRKPKTTGRSRKPKKEPVEKDSESETDSEEAADPPKGRKPKTTRKPRAAAKKDTTEQECPSGYKFGVETDKHDACDTCSIWNECNEAKESRK